MTQSDKDAQDEQICSRRGRGSPHCYNVSGDAVPDSSDRDSSDRLYNRVRSARRSHGMTLWILSVFVVLCGIIWYLYGLFPSSVQVSTEIPVLLAHPETIHQQLHKTPPESFVEIKTNQEDQKRAQGQKMVIPPTPSPMVSAIDRKAQTVTTSLSIEHMSNSLQSMIVVPVTPAPASTVAVVPPPATSSTSEGMALKEQHAEPSRRLSGQPSAGTPAVPSLTAPIMPASRIRLQLGSFKRRRDAERGWSQLTHRHGDILGGIPHAIIQVNLGLKGTWYRVYAGPYKDVRRALFVCHTLQERHADCLFSPISNISKHIERAPKE